MFGNLLQKFENHALESQVQSVLQESQQTIQSLHAFDQQYQQNPQPFSDPGSQQVLVRMKSAVTDLSQAQDALQNGSISLEDHAGVQSAITRIHADIQSLQGDLQQLRGQASFPDSPSASLQSQGQPGPSGTGGSGLFGDLFMMSALGLGGGMLMDDMLDGGQGSGNSGSGNSSGGGSGSGGSGSGSGVSSGGSGGGFGGSSGGSGS